MSEKSVFDSKGRIMTFKLITDSTADLDEKWANAHDVEILGLTIQLDGKTYETVGENRLTSETLLDSMKNGSKPTTSQINVGQFEEVSDVMFEMEKRCFIWHFHLFFQERIKVR